MKTLRKLIPVTQKKEKDEGKLFPNLSPPTTGNNRSGDVIKKDVKAKGTNHYTLLRIKPRELPARKKSQESKTNGNKDITTINQKEMQCIPLYEEILHGLIVSQLTQNVSNFDSLPKNERNLDEYQKLVRLRQELNLKKFDMDFLEWKAYVHFLLNRTEWRLQLLRNLIKTFIKVINHVPENAAGSCHIDLFMTHIQQCSGQVWSDIIQNSINRLIKQPLEPTEVDVLLDAALLLLGEFWHYLETSNLGTTGAMTKANIESILTKLKTEIVTISNQMFSLSDNDESEESLPTLLAAVTTIGRDLADNKLYWTNLFHRYKIKLDLFEIVYSVWDLEIFKAVVPVLQAAKSSITTVQFRANYPDLSQQYEAGNDISLFTLYKTLRQFSNMTDKPGLPNFVHVKSHLYSWFYEFVPQWIDVACYRALTQIDKALRNDNLESITTDCKRSHSSTFTVNTFSAMEISWKELDWPNPQETYSFALLTLKNFDRCIQFYAEGMCNAVQELDNENSFESLSRYDKAFIAINNVEFVFRNVSSIVDNVGIENLVAMLQKAANRTEIGKTSDADLLECPKEKQPDLVGKWKDNIHKQISNRILWAYEKKIGPPLNKCLETAFSTDEIEQDSGELLVILSRILERMRTRSTEHAPTFPTIGDRILDGFLNFAERNTEPSQFYILHLDEVLINVCALFQNHGLGCLVDKRENEIKRVLECQRLYKSSTDELIIEYFKRRYQEQCKADDQAQGILSVIAEYSEGSGILCLNVLNASLTKIGEVNLYFNIQIYSTDTTSNSCRATHIKYQSKVQKRTKFPLYQESFYTDIPKAVIDAGGFIHFCIKMRQFYNWKFCGECFLPLESIVRRTANSSSSVCKPVQSKLPITIPTATDTQILDLMEHRKETRGLKFSKTQRQRMVSTKQH